MKHVTFRSLSTAILSLTIIVLMEEISTVSAFFPPKNQEDPYPPPSTPGAPSGYPRLSLPVVFGKPTWDGFEDFGYYIASSNNLYHLGRRRALALSRIGFEHMSLGIIDFGCASGDNSVESWEYEGELHKILSLNTVETGVKEHINGFY